MGKRIGIRKPFVTPDVAANASPGVGAHDDEINWRTFDPSVLKGGVDAPLATEFVTYRDGLDELLRHEGQFVVIKGREIAGYFIDRETAIAAAIARYGRGPVLIKKIVEREPVRRIGHAVR